MIMTLVTEFQAGLYVSWAAFETLCERNDVRIPARTKGAGRKHVVSVSKRGYKHREGEGKEAVMDALFQVSLNLAEVLGDPNTAGYT